MRKLTAVVAVTVGLLSSAGCDPCSQACCLLCLAGLGGSGTQSTFAQPQGSVVRAEAKAVLDHVVEDASHVASQKY